MARNLFMGFRSIPGFGSMAMSAASKRSAHHSRNHGVRSRCVSLLHVFEQYIGDLARFEQHRVVAAFHLEEAPAECVAILRRELVERAGSGRGAVPEGLGDAL